MGVDATAAITATMQDFPLTLQHLLWRMERIFPRSEVVSRQEAGLHRCTFGDVAARARRLASALARLGVGPGDVVGSLAFNHYRHLELYYGVPAMGAVLHTLNFRLPEAHLEHVIRDAGDRCIFADAALLPALERLAGRVPEVRQIVVIGASGPVQSRLGPAVGYEELLAGGEDGFAWPRLDERTPAGICYTSGTTGLPKGVVYSHRSQVLHALGAVAAYPTAEGDALMPVVPMFHVNGWGWPYMCAFTGAKLVMPDRWMADGAALLELAAGEGVTLMAGVPTIWMALAEAMEKSGRRLPAVRHAFCGGSAMPRALMERMDRLGVRLLHAWGMTETSPLATMGLPRAWHAGEDIERARLSQGAPVGGVELRIADLGDGHELPWDGASSGEIQVRGPWIAGAYHGGAGAEAFTADGWLRTGDVATVDPDGFVRIVDRAKDLIKSGGEWISSVELEDAVMTHPGVAEAAVVGVPHPRWQERPLAFVVAREGGGAPLTAEMILAHLQDRVPRWWLPDEVRFVAAIPKTSVGKADKRALRELAAGSQAG